VRSHIAMPDFKCQSSKDNYYNALPSLTKWLLLVFLYKTNLISLEKCQGWLIEKNQKGMKEWNFKLVERHSLYGQISAFVVWMFRQRKWKQVQDGYRRKG
jgi:hypothetical protein